MKRRSFISLAGTYTGGALVLPDFLHAFGKQRNLIKSEACVVFIQLNGGNDGLNTFVPYNDPLYATFRPAIALLNEDVISKNNGMAFHPALKGLADIQQNGHLSVIQNVGYPEPNRSHFRSQEIWQTASSSDQYLNEGWLGRYLDLQCKDHQPTAGMNLDAIDNLALKGLNANALTVKDPNRFRVRGSGNEDVKLSGNPQLDFVRKIANALPEGSNEIQQALSKSKNDRTYPATALGRNLNWIGRLIKGNLNSKVYYTSLGGFDTHDNQLTLHNRQLTQMNDAVHAFYKDMKEAQMLQNVTVVIFSEFGRRVKDNGKGTDHGTAAPVFVIGGENQGKVIGSNPDLTDLDKGDLKYKIDFRSVYASLLEEKLSFEASKIGIEVSPLKTLF